MTLGVPVVATLTIAGEHVSGFDETNATTSVLDNLDQSSPKAIQRNFSGIETGSLRSSDRSLTFRVLSPLRHNGKEKKRFTR
jgi:hypothetical protein